jgi:hypothetical protein
VDSVQNDILDGAASLIAAASLATYSKTGTYTDGQTGIFFKIVAPLPDRIVTLTAYLVTDDPSLPMSRYGLQVRCRGLQDPRDVDELGDSIATILNGLTNVMFGGVHVIQCLRQSSITLGQDDSKRWDRADGYFLDVDTPPTLLRPVGGTY